MTTRRLTYADYAKLSSHQQTHFPDEAYQTMVEGDAEEARARLQRASRRFNLALCFLDGVLVLGIAMAVAGVAAAILS